MKHILSLIASLFCAATAFAQSLYTATPQSLERYTTPEWFQDAKLGYWVHWGLYSVPSFAGDHAAEWYGRWLYTVKGEELERDPQARGYKTAEHHRATYGDPATFGYHDFIPMWKTEKFDADEWGDLFASGGAKFFTMMAMHHDNYPLWNSETVAVNSYTTGPKRDFVAEMEGAIRSRGLKFGVSNHSAWNSRFFEFFHKNGFKSREKIYGNSEIGASDVSQWWARSTELVERYHPDLVWYDWCWNQKPFDMQTRMNFTSWYYNRAAEWGIASPESPEVVVAYKGEGRLPDGSAVLDIERGGMADIHPYPWMTDTSLGLKSWSYAPDEIYRSPNQVVDMLVDIVSKNGVLLLNIGPKADGSIPEVAQETIRAIGSWLEVNGEAIYATRPWCIYGEGVTVPSKSMGGDEVEYTPKDVRFTRSKDNKNLYITFLGYPGKKCTINSLHEGAFSMSGAGTVTLLSSGQAVKWSQDKRGLHLVMAKGVDDELFAYSFRLEFEGGVPELTSR